MKFGQYELFGRIAVGGMAEIYRGRAVGEEGFEKPVAIKRILPHFAQDARFVTMLLTEARIHAALSHRNIVQIHDLGVSEEGEYFIVLEYVDGRDLGAVLEVLRNTASPQGRSLRLSDAVALYIIIELGEGVHFAHELRGSDGQPLGLVHRDISPSNVLLSYAGEVKLSDFGLAKRRTDHSVVGSLKGKLAYMSPEQARRSTLDRRTDIFALGAVLFEMLTGRRLRDITDDVEGWRQVASGLVPPPQRFRPDMPKPLERVLAGALAPDPRDRFADARTFVAAAREALDVVTRAPAGESAELQALMRALLPPGSPRPVMAASKVVRLVSEFFPSDKTVRAPQPTAPPRRNTSPVPAPGIAPPPPVPADVPMPGPRLLPAPSPTPLLGPPQPTGAVTGARGGLMLRPPMQPTGPGLSLARSLPQPSGPGGLWRRVIVAALLGLPAGAAFVHFVLVPLPVLWDWRTPARVAITSDPDGAEVLLDGQPLGPRTPTAIDARRDRRGHLLELRKEGFQTAKRTIRFDQERSLSVSVTLQAESRPSIQPMPAPAAPSPSPDARPREAPDTRPRSP